MSANKKLSAQIQDWCLALIIVIAIALVGNRISGTAGMIESIPGMIILGIIALLSLLLSEDLPFKMPTVIYVSVIGLLLALPFSPVSDFVIDSVNKISLSALSTPVLAYAGVVVGRDWRDFAKVGWRGLVVSLLVIVGTFLVSGGIAELMARFM
ncbi:hypothetical protein [Aerococcus kribbianus]|uniref:DUF340 domain-containing protein n=1 Tax=Aerococcus kribbianus TaxID=2999064 RepID=A0A9X3FRN5_9LACT|nr:MULTISPECIES: hypothetical protein [unclassified Aerococcus]MCZ0717107.1 hypothetical protein [Aerococcus sp. YH-aer221]MCZ0725395.1 hypothetical protein [Aerococcus sp. YH-aer222]